MPLALCNQCSMRKGDTRLYLVGTLRKKKKTLQGLRRATEQSTNGK
jgi:hypothetical protein